jgi:hypothetical protein
MGAATRDTVGGESPRRLAESNNPAAGFPHVTPEAAGRFRRVRIPSRFVSV